MDIQLPTQIGITWILGLLLIVATYKYGSLNVDKESCQFISTD